MKEKEKTDAEYDYESAIYLFLLDIHGDNGYTISCKNRDRIKHKALSLAKIFSNQENKNLKLELQQLEKRIKEFEEMQRKLYTQLKVESDYIKSYGLSVGDDTYDLLAELY